MYNPLFSILIAQYNNGRFFEDCYHSIMAQTYQNWETIIVDDGSTDDSVEQMRKLIADDDRFKIYINAENKGCGFTKRRCAELASGDICGFLDPDDTLSPDAIEVMCNAHLNNPETGLIYSNFIYCDADLHPQKVHYQRQAPNGQADFFNLNGEMSAFATFKKSVYVKTEGIDIAFRRAVDQDLYFKLYEKGAVLHVDRDLYFYRLHNNGISTHNNSGKALQWKYAAIISAALRRNYNIENLFSGGVIQTEREKNLEYEIGALNRSFIFKAMRKIGLFK